MKILCVANRREYEKKVSQKGLGALITYPKIKKRYKEFAPHCFVDSGAYTFQRGINKEKLYKIIEEYGEWIQKTNFTIYVEMDLYNLFKESEIDSIRKKLKETKKYILPVYHNYQPIERFKKLLGEAPYIGFSVFDYRLFSNQAQQILQMFNKPPLLHLFGETSFLLYYYPFWTADSSTWLSPFRWGFTLHPVPSTLKIFRNIPKKRPNKLYKRELEKNLDAFLTFQKTVTSYWQKRGIYYESEYPNFTY